MNVEQDLAALQEMTTDELRDRYAEIFGEEPRSRHKAYLIRKVAWRIQANAEGDLSERARRRAAELAVDAEVRTTPPRGRSDANTIKDRTSTKVAVSRDPRLPHPEPRSSANTKGARWRSACSGTALNTRASGTRRCRPLPRRSPDRTATASDSSNWRRDNDPSQ